MQLAKPPLFFQEIPPPPRHHPNWKKADDFTNGQALIYRVHEATFVFPSRPLNKHYEKLLLKDERLAELSRMPFPALESASSNAVVMGNQINNEPALIGSSGQNRLHNDMAVNSEPAFVGGSASEAQNLEQNCASVDEEALAEALVREADAACDDDLWSMIDECMKQTQEDHGNVAVVVLSPPSKP
ncbi:hypothetical protein SASPL_110076 [Salvia splendens]|uniref:TRF2/HOY1 PH-like domain-containing protein n=1 Tax=Salvia splendens TaxID=180675 RepID=A0A8X8Y9A6_SALSN|nr:hypothetical protein SASPL_110076 [Salvia splendens]